MEPAPLLLLGRWVAASVLAISLGQQLFYAVLLFIALGALVLRPPLKRLRSLWSTLVDLAPPLTILVPAHDEELTIETSVRALLALQYPDFEVVVVNDGSRDRTLERLIAAFDLEREDVEPAALLAHAPIRAVYRSRQLPNLRVVDKEQGGKADALNAGLNFVETPLFCAVDADSLLESDSLLRAVEPFVEDERTIAVGGTVRVANGCRVEGGRVVRASLPRRLLPLLQTIEYLRAFVMARLAFERLGALLIISGAFGVFRTALAIEAGGYRRDTVGEDFELVVRMHRHACARRLPHRIRFVPEPICWTQVPERLTALARQRIRWHRGALETFFTHRRLLTGGYGAASWIGFASLFVLDVVTPLVELVGYVIFPIFWMLGIVWWPFILAWLALTFVAGIAISAGALILEELELRQVPRARDLLLLALAAVVENFGYRQLVNFWRLVGHWRYLRGVTGWGRQPRLRFEPA